MRVPVAGSLGVFTAMIVAGAVVPTTAPSIWVYLLGRVLAASASGALAVANMGAVVRGLTGTYRCMTLVFTSAFSWRWAMLMYLPLLFVGRFVLACQLPPASQRQARATWCAMRPCLAGGIVWRWHGPPTDARSAGPGCWPVGRWSGWGWAWFYVDTLGIAFDNALDAGALSGEGRRGVIAGAP